jgi:hypothetical protein
MRLEITKGGKGLKYWKHTKRDYTATLWLVELVHRVKLSVDSADEYM